MAETPPPEWAPPPESANDAAAPQARKPPRIFLWVFLALQVLFLIWVILAAASGSGTPEECRGQTGQNLQTCKDASDVGTTIGVGLIIGLWAAVDIILGFTYLIYRLGRRSRSS
jgi:hypothetical protein